MSKQIPDLVELQKSQVDDDDLMLIRDVSDNRDKKATIGNIVGKPREGWIVVISDIWTYVSYSSTTKIGEVSCNAGALGIYSIGMRVQFTQTSVIKYGIIIDITDTSLTILMINSTTLENKSLEEIKYSQSFAPQTATAVNFFGTLLTGQIDGLPVILAVKNSESDPDVPAQTGYVILEAILGDGV